MKPLKVLIYNAEHLQLRLKQFVLEAGVRAVDYSQSE